MICLYEKLEYWLHPNNHVQGCTPCVSKNLDSKKLPNCFFNLMGA